MATQVVQQQIEAFKNTVEPFLDQWRSLDIRLVAIKSQEAARSPFQNAAATITLSPSPLNEVTQIQDLPDLDWLKAIHEIRPIGELDSILSALATGKAIVIKDIEVAFTSDNCSTSFYKYQRGEGYTSSPKDWTYYSLMLDSKFAPTLDPRRADEELKGGDIPFVSLDELIRGFPLWRPRWESYRSYLGMLEINAPCGIRIADTRWENQVLRIAIDRAPYWEFKDIDLGLIYNFGPDFKQRRSERIENSTFGAEDKVEIELRLPADLRAVTILLRTKRNTVDQTTVYHPELNPRLKLYEIFDKNLEKLGSWFSLEGESSENFEKAVETLLFLCGYSIVPCVRHFRQDGRLDIRGIDCLAVDAKGNLLVVECTTGPIDSDKLEKLRYRNNSVRNSGFNGSAIVFTTATRESISKDIMKKAHDDKISIAAREDIEALLSLIKRNAHLDEVMDLLDRYIPSSFPFA